MMQPESAQGGALFPHPKTEFALAWDAACKRENHAPNHVGEAAITQKTSTYPLRLVMVPPSTRLTKKLPHGARQTAVP